MEDNNLKKLIDENPSIVLKLYNLSDELYKYAFSKGINVTFDDLMSNISLRYQKDYLYKSYENDVHSIIFFTEYDLTNDIIDNAIKRGYIPSIDDLKFNYYLTNNKKLMELAIINNPKCILYLNNTNIDINILKNALSKYQITEEDIKEHPNITKNYNLMSLLPIYHIYTQFLTDNERYKYIKDYLNNNKDINNLPFLQKEYGANLNKKQISSLIDIYNNTKIDQDNLDIQEEYLNYLNKINDACARLEYKDSKDIYKFKNIAEINEFMISCFKDNKIDKCINTIYEFMGNKESLYITFNTINYLYNLYLDNKLTKEKTSIIYNLILNEHMNNQINIFKNKINDERYNFNLTKTKTSSIINGLKIKLLNEYLKNKEYNMININEEYYNNLLKQTYNNIINNNKYIKECNKNNININNTNKEIYNLIFNNNLYEIDNKYISNHTNINNNEIINIISNYISKMLYELAKNINPNIRLIDNAIKNGKDKLTKLNQFDYIIADNNYLLKNISYLINNISSEDLNIILNNKHYKDIIFLLYYADRFDYFTINDFINIAKNIDTIINKLNNSNHSKINKTYFLNRLDYIILMANYLEQINVLDYKLLGNYVMENIDLTNLKDYENEYGRMYCRYKSSIPPVNIKGSDIDSYHDNYEFISGDYHNTERLLINYVNGRHYCIDLHEAGENTYKECLEKESGDVILVKKDNKVIDRIFAIRRGNVIQLFTIVDEIKYNSFLYKAIIKIVDNMVKEIKNNNDNIDYILLNNESIYSIDNNKESYKDNNLIDKFPHGDLEDSAIILYKNKDKDINYDEEYKSMYYLKRKDIRIGNEDDVNKIRYLYNNINHIKDNNIYYYNPDDTIYVGEDFYVIINDNTIVETLVIGNDTRAYEEIDNIYNMIQNKTHKL